MENPFLKIREATGLSVLQWCHEINLSPQAVYRIEEGHGASKGTCVRVAARFPDTMQAVGVTLADLLLWPEDRG